MNALEILKERVSEENVEVWEEVRNHIRCDPGIQDGIPTFVGTRVPVSHVLDCMGDGMTTKEILAAFPTLEPAHIPAALKFAGLLADNP